MDKKNILIRKWMGSNSIILWVEYVYNYGDIFLQKKQTIGNKFWNDVVQSVFSVDTNATVRSLENLLAMPLWYNTKIISEKIQSWVDRGILTNGDIKYAEGHIFTIEYIKNDLQLNCDFLMYNRLKKRVQLILGNNQISQNDYIRPRLPFILYIIEAGGKGNKNTYFNSQNTGLNILSE